MLTHYIIVRRDLPTGVAMAMVAHAAGESFGLCAGSSILERSVINGEVGGVIPSPRSIPKPTVVVLGARNEAKLLKLAQSLLSKQVNFAAITEPDAPYSGQLMAVGLALGQKAELLPHVKEFQMWFPE